MSKIGLTFAFLLAFVDEALDPTEGVIARPADLATYIDADGTVTKSLLRRFVIKSRLRLCA